MREETKTLILYRLERAYESLEEAAILLEKGYANTFVIIDFIMPVSMRFPPFY
jgi:hypothetical protein